MLGPYPMASPVNGAIGETNGCVLVVALPVPVASLPFPNMPPPVAVGLTMKFVRVAVSLAMTFREVTDTVPEAVLEPPTELIPALGEPGFLFVSPPDIVIVKVGVTVICIVTGFPLASVVATLVTKGDVTAMIGADSADLLAASALMLPCDAALLVIGEDPPTALTPLGAADGPGESA